MSFVLGLFYSFFVVYFWMRAKENFEVENNTQGWIDIVFSAVNGAALGALIL